MSLDGQRMATEAPKAPALWLRQVERTGNGESLRDALSLLDQRAEFLMMGLRLSEGVDRGRFDMGDLDININKLIEIGMIETEAERMRVTAAGRPVLNAVLRGILA